MERPLLCLRFSNAPGANYDHCLLIFRFVYYFALLQSHCIDCHPFHYIFTFHIHNFYALRVHVSVGPLGHDQFQVFLNFEK